MKTIKFLSDTLKSAIEQNSSIEVAIGTFVLTVNRKPVAPYWTYKTTDRYRLRFRLEFRPDHIQMLFQMGVTIDLSTAKMANLSETAKRFKSGREAISQGRYAPYYYMGDPANYQTGTIENWLHADASCSIETLQKLDLICRDNHTEQVAIHNDHNLKLAGFIPEKTPISNTPERVIEHANRTESIRKSVRRWAQGKKDTVLPYTQRCMVKNRPFV